MKIGCCGIGLIGMVFRAIGKVIDAIVSVIVYLGLYWPIFYLTVILGLWIWGGMTFEPSIELALFYVGLVISILCSIMVTLRHIILEPLGKYLDRRAEEREAQLERMRAKRRKRRAKEVERERRARERRYIEERENEYRERRMDDRRRRYYEERRVDRPRVYRSNRDRSLIIYEYRDRFEVYREGERGLRQIDTKWK